MFRVTPSPIRYIGPTVTLPSSTQSLFSRFGYSKWSVRPFTKRAVVLERKVVHRVSAVHQKGADVQKNDDRATQETEEVEVQSGRPLQYPWRIDGWFRAPKVGEPDYEIFERDMKEALEEMCSRDQRIFPTDENANGSQ